MSCCNKNNKLPTKTKQATNLFLSVVNAIAHAIKTGKISANESTVSSRINICQSCRHLTENRCSICGCFVNMKVGIQSEKCPVSKW